MAAFISMPIAALASKPAGGPDGESVYKLKPADPSAKFFNADNTGKTDVSQALQDAINTLKKEQTAGILFIPEGTYLISRTIYIPTNIRVIGYGEKRPVIKLKEKTFTSPADWGASAATYRNCPEGNYMIYFTGNVVEGDVVPSDANAGTFYSALSNVNLTVGKGNPYAVCVRSHFAQHGFISHVDFNIGDGISGIVEFGNENEDLRFYGGDYGIIASTPSPGWPMVGVDYLFEGQRKAGFKSGGNSIFTMVGFTFRNMPVAIDCGNVYDRIYMENSRLENIFDVAVKIGKASSELTQFNFVDVFCKNVPVFSTWDKNYSPVAAPAKSYVVKDFTFGTVQENLAADAQCKLIMDIQPAEYPAVAPKIIPMLPQMSSWISVRDFGAVGDGVADDTKAIYAAMEAGDNIYFPCGVYRVSETIKMKENTKFIGLHPFATHLLLGESTPAFSGFGGPVALLESSLGGANYLNGIGINTGGMNYRAVGVKWMAGKDSYMNDVKYIGGHGTLKLGPMVQRSYSYGAKQVSSPSNAIAAQGKDLAWDNQYWSLWVTNGGGGIFKDIWTASTYATSGLYVSNTDTPASVFCISLEHHVRSEARFDNVKNWKLYGFQTEEESREGLECQTVDMNECEDITFINSNTFRVIRVITPWQYAYKVSNCKNIVFRNLHNYAQVKQVHNYVLTDLNNGQKIIPWSFAKAVVTGDEPAGDFFRPSFGGIKQIATGFQFAEGLTVDSKGNVYFLEHLQRRIYKYDVASGKIKLITDVPFKPMLLACDSQDNLMVIVRYDPQGGLMVNGKPDAVPTLEDDNVAWSGWGNGGWGPEAYSIDPDDPDNTFTVLERVPSKDLKNIGKAFYPTSRWRYDTEAAVVKVPVYYFKGVDGVTYIPETHDLTRTASLSAALPGQKFMWSDEGQKKLATLDVDAAGRLSNLQYTDITSEFGFAVDKKGNIYVGAGHIEVYSPSGKHLKTIHMPERPTALSFGGVDGNTLYVTTRESLFEISL